VKFRTGGKQMGTPRPEDMKGVCQHCRSKVPARFEEGRNVSARWLDEEKGWQVSTAFPLVKTFVLGLKVTRHA
jgi:hypothetical protein